MWRFLDRTPITPKLIVYKVTLSVFRYSNFFESTNQLTNQSTNRIGKIIHTFLPIKKNNEVNTNILVNAIWSNDKYNEKDNNIKIVVPKVICIDGSKKLEHYYLY